MIDWFTRFAAEEPNVHVAPGSDFTLGGLTISNSVLYGWICATLIIIGCIWVARKVTVRPKAGVVQFIEAGVEFARNLVENAFDDPKIGRKYVPFFVTLFFFILFNNWLGLLPIVGEGLHVQEHPVFRPFTADLNGTLAIGFVTMIVVYVASIREVGGPIKYLKHFFLGSPLNPLYLIIGLIEILTDLTRVFSLSLRLFLNVAIGEIVIAVFAYLGTLLGSLVAPIVGDIGAAALALPFTLLELGVGALQAYIFTILGTMYLAISVNSAHQDHGLTEDGVPGTMEATAGATSGRA